MRFAVSDPTEGIRWRRCADSTVEVGRCEPNGRSKIEKKMERGRGEKVEWWRWGRRSK